MTGPWIYSVLQQFIYYYITNDKKIPINILENFVNQYYSNCNVLQKQNIVQQLFAFQHDIYDKQNYVVYDFQEDSFDNQFTLFKYKDYNKYEDAGEIWVRLKNYPLSVPLMNYVSVSESLLDYRNDKFDTLQIN